MRRQTKLGHLRKCAERMAQDKQIEAALRAPDGFLPRNWQIYKIKQECRPLSFADVETALRKLWADYGAVTA